MGIVAVLCFVLAASFLIKLAIDSGWLTPLRQLGLATLLGLALVASGLGLAQRERSYASLLSGAGIVVLHLCVFAGRLYFGFYSGWTATFLAGGVSMGSIVLYRRFSDDFYAAVAVLGSYLSVLLIPTDQRGGFELMAFFLVWDLAYAVIAGWITSRATLLLASYLGLGLFSIQSTSFGIVETPSVLFATALFQAAQLAIFAWGIVRYSLRHRSPMTAGEIWAYFPLLIFFYGLEYHLVSRLCAGCAPWIALAFAAAVFGIYRFARTNLGDRALESESFASAFAAIVGFHAFYLELLPEAFAPLFALALLAATPWIFARLQVRGRHAIVALAILAVVAINFIRALFGPGPDLSIVAWAGVNLGFFALLSIGYGKTKRDDEWLVYLLLADTQALVGLYRLANRFVSWIGWAVVERFAVSVAWGLLALGILLFAKSRFDRTLARSSLFVFGIATGKILLFDVASAGAVARIFCLLALGAALYAGGYLYRHIERWES